MAEIKKRWYVLRVIGGKEKKVKEYIENEVASLGLQDYVSQVLKMCIRDRYRFESQPVRHGRVIHG